MDNLNYPLSTAASASFLRIGNSKALRVNVPKLSRRFTDLPETYSGNTGHREDVISLGTVLKGTFYYRDPHDLNATGSHHYHIKKTVSSHGVPCVEIDFKYGFSSTTPYAKFVADQPGPGDADITDSDGVGTWQRTPANGPVYPPVIVADAAKYLHSTAASALLFKNDHNKALRVEVPGLGMEFTDGLYIGKDPDGIFHYNTVKDLKKSGTHYYTVNKVLDKNGKTICVIDFSLNSASATPYAKFIAEDLKDAVYGAGMVNYSNTGSWDVHSSASSFSTVKKTSTSQEITLTADAIGKKATWTAPSDILQNTGFNVDGILYFKKLNELADGVYASYNNDRIVFYENDYTGHDFTAYFIPLESDTTTLQVSTSNTVIFEEVSWD